ncbi:MAG: flagellar hook-length control protein FliK [Desulfuromonadaceae bacterium]|nr:flagellar hook-length control protein FliK [Desulfuromonadaceae bacterium]MDD5104051.1 flagellar hook-length control protein FliK [Desulfuromonadaceae bacterium]
MAVTPDVQQQVLDLLSRASNISFVTADQAASSGNILSPGQRVSAEVISMLPNNRVQVQIGPERFNLDLPMAVRIGQAVEMTFVSNDPRSTFAISRQAGLAPPVSLSDASRLLSLLVSNEQFVDPKFRSSLQSIGDLLRNSAGETGVLANLMDEALTYGILREGVKGVPQTLGDAMQERTGQQATKFQQGLASAPSGQARLAMFENNAAAILRTIAQNSRFVLIEAANQPVTALPLLPGDEVEAAVIGTLPGGRVFVQVAGTALEMVVPRMVQAGDILRLTYISSQPKPTFAFPRTMPDSGTGILSEAGRWLSVLEHSAGGVSSQQTYVLDRLSAVLKSLPPNSPAFTAILDEAITYQTVRRNQAAPEQFAAAQTALQSAQGTSGTAGNGLVLGDDMAKLLQAIIKGNRLALLEALAQQALPSGLTPGQQLKGEVLATLGGGRFMVQVAGRNFEFMLPKGIVRGETLNLFYIAEEPHATFLMVRFGSPGDSHISNTGRWLSGFLSDTANQATTQTIFGLFRTLLAGPTSDAALLSRTLQQGLQGSGLFYEAHLARWFGGDYPLEDILKEPQGRLSPRLAQPGQQTPVLANELARATLQTGFSKVMEAMFHKAGAEAVHVGNADQRALPMVGEQLLALQNSTLLFRGDLFPGRQMEWQVAEREGEHNNSGSRERSWESSISITLPNLGTVTSSVRLDGTHVSVAITAEEFDTVPVLEAGRGRLADQFEGAGLTPAEMSISHAAT